jgi:hypothetical protein
MLGAANALAKCPTENYVVTGRAATRAGVPVANATVTVHWKDATGGGEKSTKTAESGRYRIEFRSSTLSGDDKLRGDVCKAALSSAKAVAAAPGYASASAVVEFKDRKGKADFALLFKRSLARLDLARIPGRDLLNDKPAAPERRFP